MIDLQVGEAYRIYFTFTVNDIPVTGLAPAPTGLLKTPGGTESGFTLTAEAATDRYYYDFDQTNIGNYEVIAWCEDASVDIGDARWAEQLSVGREWIESIGGNAPTVGQITEGIWEELAADHTDPITMGGKMNAAGASGDPLASPVPGAYPPGTGGWQLGQIGSANIGVNSPVLAGGKIILYQGSLYSVAAGSSLPWRSYSTLPLDTATSVVLRIDNVSYTVAVTGVVGNWLLQGEITSEQSLLLRPDSHTEYAIEATIAGALMPPLAFGPVTIIGRR